MGITAIPGPVTDGADDGWFVYQGINQSIRAISQVGVRPDFSVRYPFDSKAKRITHDGQSIAIVVENAVSSAGAFNIAIQLRILSMVRGT